MSPDDLAELFGQVFLEIFGGGFSIKSMFRGLNQRQMKRMPPFPFPKELFPPGTFPPGVRFSRRGLHGMPDEMIEALLGGGAGRAAASFFSQPSSEGNRERRNDDDSDGWETVSEDDGEGEEEKGEGENGQEEEEEEVDSDDDSDYEEPPPSVSIPKARDPNPTVDSSSSSSLDKRVVKDWFEAAKNVNISTLSTLASHHPNLLPLQGLGLGHTALHWLAARGDPGSIAWMLSLPGAQVNILNSMMKSTPLHAAAGNGKDENVRLLLSRGADRSILDTDGRDAAMLADEHGHKALAEMIRGWKGPSPSSHSHPPPSLVKAPPSKAPPAPAPPPSSSPSKEDRARRRAELLAEAEAAERDEDELEAKRSAAATQASLDSGVEPQEGRSFIEAVKDGNLSVLTSMLQANPRLLHWKGEGTNYAFTGHTCLHWAAARGHSQIVRWLIELAKADPKAMNASGSLPIHSACDNLQMSCVEVLVLIGGSNLSDLDGLGSSGRDLMVARGVEEGKLRRADLASRASALIMADGQVQGEEEGALIKAILNHGGAILNHDGGGEGEVISELVKKWAIHPMRTFLVSSGLSASALPLEKKDLQASCIEVLRTLLKSLPSLPAANLAPPPLQARQKGEQSQGQSNGSEGPVTSAKAKGNKAFVTGQFKQAVQHYTTAINISDSAAAPSETAVLYSNRSAANVKLSFFGLALDDAVNAIKLDPQNPKYWVRKGCALQGHGRVEWGEAKKAFEEALRLQPGYEAAAQGLKDLQL